MQVSTEQIDPCKVTLTISVEPEKVQETREKVFQQFAREIVIPGFRKGKVPPQMARQYIDPNRVRERTAELLVGPAYSEALQQTQIEAFGGLNPEMELIEMNDGGPFVFKVFVPLRPVVTLGPYKGLSFERRLIPVQDADVEQQLDQVLTRHAEYPPVEDRSAQIGDVIFAQISTRLEDQDQGTDTQPAFVEIGKNLDQFDAGVVGMNPGETRVIEITYPNDFKDRELRGKKAYFTVELKELRAKILPEMTEEFISKIHANAKTEDELRAAMRQSLEQAAAEMTENDLEFRLVNSVVTNSQVFFPDGLVRNEMQADINQLQERLKRENITISQYLESVGQTEQELAAELAESASRRIRNSLVLAEVARTEQITVDDSDLDQIIAERAEQAKVSPAAVRAFAEKNDQLSQFRDQALTRKILQFLKDAAHIADRPLTPEEMEEELEEDDGGDGVLPVGEAAPLALSAARTIRPRRSTAEGEASLETADESGATGNAETGDGDEPTPTDTEAENVSPAVTVTAQTEAVPVADVAPTSNDPTPAEVSGDSPPTTEEKPAVSA